MAQGDASQVTTGIFGTADLFTEQRKYDKDKSKFFVWKERGHAQFTHVLITKIKKVEVSDPQPKHFEDGYRGFEFTANGDSAGALGSLSHNLTLSTTSGMVAGQLYKVQSAVTGNNGWTKPVAPSNIAALTDFWAGVDVARGTTYTSEEVIRVTAIVSSTVVTIRRAIGADTIGGGVTPPTIKSTTKLWHIGETAVEGSDSPSSFSQNPTVVNNVVEDFRVSYEITDIAEKIDVFGENEWQRKARNARKDFARRIERAFIAGRMYVDKDGTSNQNIYHTGGIDQWIPSANRINAGRSISQTYMNTVLKDVFMNGSEDKIGLCGYGYMTLLGNACADKIRYNEGLSNDLGIEVNSFTASGGGTVHFIPDFEMSKMGQDNECYYADINYLAYMFMNGLDIYINKGPNGNGVQGNGETKKKHEIRGVIGLKRTFQDAHSHHFGIS